MLITVILSIFPILCVAAPPHAAPVSEGRISSGVSPVGSADARVPPAPFGTFGLPLEYLIAASVGVDSVGLTRMLIDARSVAKNREGFVKDALFKSMYAGHGNYSVLVFNLKQKYRWDDEPAVEKTLYTSIVYGRNVYAIWIFQDRARFQNFGSDDPANWAYYGRIKRDRGNLTFYEI